MDFQLKKEIRKSPNILFLNSAPFNTFTPEEWINVFGKDNNHLSLRLMGVNYSYKAVFFNHGHLANDFTVGQKIDIAYTVKENYFNDKTYIDLIIKDFKPVL